MRLMLLALLGCASEKNGSTDSADSSGDELSSSDWQRVAEDIPGGVLLSAWSDGDAMRVVGGDLGGGSGMMVHLQDGVLCWEADVTERALWWIHGDGASTWVAVGESGTILLSEDGARRRIDIETEATLFGAWMDGAEIWVAGGTIGSGENSGEVWHWDGSDWTAIAVDLPGVLFKVWDGWFVGQDVSYRWTGDALEPIPTEGRLLTVRGRSADDVWAVGGLSGPLVTRLEDGAWAPQDTTGLDQAINGVWTAPSQDIWVAGNYGTTAHWDGTEWLAPEQPLTTDHLHAVWRHQDQTWWMGGDLFNVGDNHGMLIRHGQGAVPAEPEACAD
jgi:hypothetical protein